jgi:creatinine amidohydrolase
MHANESEASAILAINPELVDMSCANAEQPAFPQFASSSTGPHTAFFRTSPGSVYRITKSGTWGDASKATAEKGRQYLDHATDSLLTVLKDIDNAFAQLPLR